MKEMIKNICEIQPDFIICTHVFPTLSLCRLKEHFQLHTPLYAYITDLSPHPFWSLTVNNVDLFFALSHTKEIELLHCGIEKHKIRRYGFHGTSHKFVARVGAEMFGLDFENSKIVTCHIGNGGSVTAVLNGKSFDTSMGFTPLDGLVMGTRAGSMDVSAATYVAEKEGMSYKELDAMLNKKSGVQGLTGISSDMRDIDAAYEEGNERAIMARDMYFNRVKKFVGEYAAEMGGVDLVVFTGGVGENSPELREYVLRNMEFMGIEFDAVRNNGKRGTDYEITAASSRVKAAVICTDEELVIAKDTFRLVGAN